MPWQHLPDIINQWLMLWLTAAQRAKGASAVPWQQLQLTPFISADANGRRQPLTPALHASSRRTGTLRSSDSHRSRGKHAAPAMHWGVWATALAAGAARRAARLPGWKPDARQSAPLAPTKNWTWAQRSARRAWPWQLGQLEQSSGERSTRPGTWLAPWGTWLTPWGTWLAPWGTWLIPHGRWRPSRPLTLHATMMAGRGCPGEGWKISGCGTEHPCRGRGE
jgi:hypothetical protein